MPAVGVGRHHPQGLPLPQTADEDRDVPGRRRVEHGQPALDARKGIGQIVETRTGGSELVAVFVVVTAIPSRTDPQHEPALGDVVDGPRHVGQQVRVAVGVAGDQRPDLGPGGLLGHRRQHRPALEVSAVAIAVERIEVVPGVDQVVAHLVGGHYGPSKVLVGTVLRMELGGDPDVTHRTMVNLPTMGRSSDTAVLVFTIGSFSALTGVSAKRLRHYDGSGLFQPVWVDPATRYRYYSATQIPDLRRIVSLVNLGIPLQTNQRPANRWPLPDR